MHCHALVELPSSCISVLVFSVDQTKPKRRFYLLLTSALVRNCVIAEGIESDKVGAHGDDAEIYHGEIGSMEIAIRVAFLHLRSCFIVGVHE
jgi:hypothetical protein